MSRSLYNTVRDSSKVKVVLILANCQVTTHVWYKGFRESRRGQCLLHPVGAVQPVHGLVQRKVAYLFPNKQRSWNTSSFQK